MLLPLIMIHPHSLSLWLLYYIHPPIERGIKKYFCTLFESALGVPITKKDGPSTVHPPSIQHLPPPGLDRGGGWTDNRKHRRMRNRH
jgi:hypothetical protein